MNSPNEQEVEADYIGTLGYLMELVRVKYETSGPFPYEPVERMIGHAYHIAYVAGFQRGIKDNMELLKQNTSE